MNVSDGICAYLQGGLGNQLFILAASWAQAKRLDVPLYIDASRYVARDPLDNGYETQRTFELHELDLPGVVIEAESPWFKNSPRRPAAVRRSSASRSLKVYRDTAGATVDSLSRIRPGTTLFGYFQSPSYFDGIQQEVADLLNRFSPTAQTPTQSSKQREQSSVTVHLRRGDYLLPHVAEHHGVTSAGYVERALGVVRRLSGIELATVFSDDVDTAREELRGMQGLEFVQEDGSRSSLATLMAMSAGQGFVMSNSSFSWWAAWLMSRDSAKPVIAPRPWSPSSSSDHRILLPDWLSMGIS